VRKSNTVGGLALCLLIVAGCGGGGGGSSSAAAPASSAAPASAATPPSISGQPATSVAAGSAYTFTPSVTDTTGAALSFSIANSPAWASFDKTKGTLSGTPPSTAVGTYSGIVISVSDGRSSASLQAFSIVVSAAASTGSATVSWTAPTTNSDGSALTNLAGFHIHYGQTSNSLTQSVTVASPSASSYVLQSLASGTWYFAVSAYTNASVESNLSTVVSKTI